MAIVPLGTPSSPKSRKKNQQDKAKKKVTPRKGATPVPMAPQKPMATPKKTPKPKPPVRVPSMIDPVKTPKPKYTLLPRKITPKRTPRIGNR